MIRTKGEAGTGDVVEAVRHIRTLHKDTTLKKCPRLGSCYIRGVLLISSAVDFSKMQKRAHEKDPCSLPSEQ